MGQGTIDQWQAVTDIIKRHDFPSPEQGHTLVPFTETKEMNTALDIGLTFDTDYYRDTASGGNPHRSKGLVEAGMRKSIIEQKSNNGKYKSSVTPITHELEEIKYGEENKLSSTARQHLSDEERYESSDE